MNERLRIVGIALFMMTAKSALAQFTRLMTPPAQ